MARNTTRGRKLTKQLKHSCLILSNVRKMFRVGPFEVNVGHQRRTTMAGTGHIHYIEVVLVDQTIEVDIDKIQTGRRAPVPKQTRFDLFSLYRLPEKRLGH